MARTRSAQEPLPDPTPESDPPRALEPRRRRQEWWRAVPLGALELTTFAGLLGALAWTFRDLSTDPFTFGAVLVVGVVWLIYLVRALTYSLPEVPLRAELERRARRRLLPTHDGPRLPAEVPGSVLDEITGDPAWQLPGWLSTGQGVLVSLGLVGTFLGLTLGLYQSVGILGAEHASPAEMQQAMSSLLDGAKLAFVKSLAGVFCGMVWSLRYRRAEVTHDHALEDQRAWLAGLFPLVTELELARAAEAERHAEHAGLLDALERWADRADERSEALVAAIERSSTAQLERVTEGVNGVTALRELIEDLSKTLPENIGDQTAGLLRPDLNRMVDALTQLSSAGSEAIGTTLQDSVGAEVDGLRQSLAQISELLEGLGPRVEQQIHQGASSAAAALTDAGRQSSNDLRGATSELTAGVAEIRSMADAVRAAVTETHQVAGALRGAGDDVASGLRGIADPLSALPTSLDGARAALFAAQDGMSRATVAASAQVERLTQLQQVTERGTELQRDLVGRSEQLVTEIDRVREACAATVETLRSSAAGQQLAGVEAAQQLVQTVTAFQDSLQQAQQAVSQASRSTFEGAQAVTLQAAKQVADALAGGAVTFEQSLGRLSAFSGEIERGLSGAREVAATLEGHVQRLQSGVASVGQPLGEVAAALGQVGPEVREAAAAVRAERDALGTLGRELSGQAATLRASSDSLAERILEYKGLQQTLSREWALHASGVDQLLQRVQQSWAQAIQAGEAGLQQNSEKIASYAKKVEQSLRINEDVRELSATLQQLADALDDLARRRAAT